MLNHTVFLIIIAMSVLAAGITAFISALIFTGVSAVAINLVRGPAGQTSPRTQGASPNSSQHDHDSHDSHDIHNGKTASPDHISKAATAGTILGCIGTMVFIMAAREAGMEFGQISFFSGIIMGHIAGTPIGIAMAMKYFQNH